MTKRYVFFRQPSGKPDRGTDSRCAPINLLAEFGRSSVLNSDGAVGWQGFFVMKHDVALQSTFVVIGPEDQELNPVDTERIIADFRRA